MNLRRLRSILAASLTACTVSPTVPAGSAILCESDDQCPSGTSCNGETGRCVRDDENLAPTISIQPADSSARFGNVVEISIEVSDPNIEDRVQVALFARESTERSECDSGIPAQAVVGGELGELRGTTEISFEWNALATLGDADGDGVVDYAPEVTVCALAVDSNGLAADPAFTVPLEIGNDAPDLMIADRITTARTGLVQLEFTLSDSAGDFAGVEVEFERDDVWLPASTSALDQPSLLAPNGAAQAHSIFWFSDDDEPEVLVGAVDGARGYLEWYEIGSGAFVAGPSIDPALRNVNELNRGQGMWAGDFDGDGLDDVALVDRRNGDVNGRIILFRATGTGFEDAQTFEGLDPRSLFLTDLDGKNGVDVIWTNRLLVGGGSVTSLSVALSRAPGATPPFAAETRYVVGDVPDRIRSTDVDGDGLLDIYGWSNFGALGFSVFLQRRAVDGGGSGLLRPQELFFPPESGLPGRLGFAIEDLDRSACVPGMPTASDSPAGFVASPTTRSATTGFPRSATSMAMGNWSSS